MRTAIYREVTFCQWCKKETLHLWEEKDDEEETTLVRLCLVCLQERLVKKPNAFIGSDSSQ